MLIARIHYAATHLDLGVSSANDPAIRKALADLYRRGVRVATITIYEVR